MQQDDLGGVSAGDRRDFRRGTSDLGSAGQKAEHVTVRTRESTLDATRHAELRRVVDLEGMRPAGNRDRRTVIEIAGHGIRVHGGRHHDDSKIVARQPCLPDEREPEIRVDAALVELVEDDRPKAGEERILLQPGRQDAFGRQQHPGVRTELLLEADVPADLAAERPAAFDGNAARDRPRRHASRLQHDDRTVRGQRRRAPAWSCPPQAQPSPPGPFAPGRAQGFPGREGRSGAGSLAQGRRSRLGLGTRFAAATDDDREGEADHVSPLRAKPMRPSQAC